jgi:hypothetical protein
MKSHFTRFVKLIFSSCLVFTLSCSPILKKGQPHGQTQNLSSYQSQFIEFSKVPFQAQFKPQVEPIPVRKKTHFKLYIWDRTEGSPSGPYTDPSFIPSVRLWMQMKSGSHGSDSPISLSSSLDSEGQVEPGVYDVKGLVFTMSGEWEVHLELKQSDGTVVDAGMQNVWVN